MLTKIYPRNPSERELRKVVAALECGGIVVYPTDGVYAFGCSLGAPKTVDRLLGLRGKERREATLVFDGIARLAEYSTDPELIDERYGRTVALVVDGGMGEASFTTVVDLTDGEPVLLREGRGELR